ncbi:MAG: DUF1207 domain-containing protein [Patescibacteria group bacterium]|nr:DUF1207 domain-containing protein [Patescibacteria group bacterium]
MRLFTGNLLLALGVSIVLGGLEARGQIRAMPPYGPSYDEPALPYGGSSDGATHDGGQAASRGRASDDLGYAAAYTSASQGPSLHGAQAPGASHSGNVPPPPGLATPHGAPIVDPYVMPVQEPAGMETGLPHDRLSWGESTQSSFLSIPPAATATPSQRQVYSSLGSPHAANAHWHWQLMPDGVIYKSYLAGLREPRLGAHFSYQRHHGWVWDSTLGGRIALLRYGTKDPAWPEGWQLDFEGAAFPRLDVENERDLVSVDFRFGSPLTFRNGPWEGKVGYYHICSHLGDEYIQTHPGATRLNYVRDAIIFGLALRPHPDVRLYAEAGYGVWTDGGAKPWEVQFGAEFSPAEPTGVLGAPFLAVNGHLREEIDFSGSVTAQAGVQWRGETGNLFRLGAHYFNGLSEQYQFMNIFEEQIGVGLWYDF